MRPLAWLRSVAAALFRRSRAESDMDEELRAHIRNRVDDLERSGMPRAEAERRARVEFGGMERFKEECREASGARPLETFVRDIRYAFRTLRKSPGFAMVAMLTLALGIGANTALFSVVNAELLNPLPFSHPNELVVVTEKRHGFPQSSISYPNFLDWVRMNHSFQALAAYREDDFDLTGSGRAERVKAMQVSSSFFHLLGVKPVVGRNFSPADDVLGAPPVAILSYEFWKRRFGGSPRILGHTLALNGTGYMVVGVIPKDFYFCCEWSNFRPGDVYITFGSSHSDWLTHRYEHPGIFSVGRLKPSVSVEEARADMADVARDLAAVHPNSDKGAGIALVPLREEMVRNVRALLFALLAAVGFVLLIACVNVASLLLVRSVGRAREFATRVALGATRGDVIRQLLTESLLLAFGGGALGLLLAFYGTQAALKVLPEALPHMSNVRLDPRVLFFTLFLTVFAGILFGLAPALKASRPNLHETLKEGGRGSSGERHRLQSAFVVAEMALAVVLLVGAGLTVRSLVRLWSVNPGFDPHSVLMFNVALPPSVAKLKPDQIRAASRQLTETVAAIPGVEAVSQTDAAQPMLSDSEWPFWIEGRPKPLLLSGMPEAIAYIVSPAYRKIMRIPISRGRFFRHSDTVNSPRVAVVDEIFAREYFPGQNPVGQYIHLPGLGKAEIVGVVGHVDQWGMARDADFKVRDQVYLLARQFPESAMSGLGDVSLVVRTATPGHPTPSTIQSAIERMNSEQVAFGFLSMDQVVARTLARRRFLMILLSAFAGAALLLASIGIYGVMSYVAEQRLHEMAIRLALGAPPAEILRLALWQGTRVALAGVALGVVGALALTRLITSLLFRVSATDPLTFAAVAALLSCVALAACYVPARRTMRTDPAIALRHE